MASTFAIMMMMYLTITISSVAGAARLRGGIGRKLGNSGQYFFTNNLPVDMHIYSTDVVLGSLDFPGGTSSNCPQATAPSQNTYNEVGGESCNWSINNVYTGYGYTGAEGVAGTMTMVPADPSYTQETGLQNITMHYSDVYVDGKHQETSYNLTFQQDERNPNSKMFEFGQTRPEVEGNTKPTNGDVYFDINVNQIATVAPTQQLEIGRAHV